MASLNKKAKNTRSTHAGGPARGFNPITELERTIASCFLWEKEFYESGESIADRITSLVARSDPTETSILVRRARHEMKLRHVPLLVIAAMVKANQKPSRETVSSVIQRPDEMGELISILWKDGKRSIPKQVKLGIGDAFKTFDEYQLGKYNRSNANVTLRDVLRLTHPKADTPAQNRLFRAVVEGTLSTPDTWEVQLSSGADKCETFTRLLQEGRLGYLALLRNLRNMVTAGVDRVLIANAIRARVGAHNVLPFRFISAARHAPSLESYLDEALIESLQGQAPMPGMTAILVDVSGSMVGIPVSARSDITRLDAAATLASMITGNRRVFSFSDTVVEVPARLGMAGVEAISHSQPNRGTRLGDAVRYINHNVPCDRLIIITDEQSSQVVPASTASKSYMINVASMQNGVKYGDWTRIDGFSENVLRFIKELEQF